MDPRRCQGHVQDHQRIASGAGPHGLTRVAANPSARRSSFARAASALAARPARRCRAPCRRVWAARSRAGTGCAARRRPPRTRRRDPVRTRISDVAATGLLRDAREAGIGQVGVQHRLQAARTDSRRASAAGSGCACRWRRSSRRRARARSMTCAWLTNRVAEADRAAVLAVAQHEDHVARVALVAERVERLVERAPERRRRIGRNRLRQRRARARRDRA